MAMGGKRGLTLAEVLVALAIVAAFALGLVAAVTHSLRLSTRDEDLTAATMGAQEKLELALATARTRAGFDGLASFPPGVYAYLDAGQRFVYRLEVTPTLEPELSRLSLTVFRANSAAPLPEGRQLVHCGTLVARP